MSVVVCLFLALVVVSGLVVFCDQCLCVVGAVSCPVFVACNGLLLLVVGRRFVMASIDLCCVVVVLCVVSLVVV